MHASNDINSNLTRLYSVGVITVKIELLDHQYNKVILTHDKFKQNRNTCVPQIGTILQEWHLAVADKSPTIHLKSNLRCYVSCFCL